jgi:hypothetical protein
MDHDGADPGAYDQQGHVYGKPPPEWPKGVRQQLGAADGDHHRERNHHWDARIRAGTLDRHPAKAQQDAEPRRTQAVRFSRDHKKGDGSAKNQQRGDDEKERDSVDERRDGQDN